jgi:uncharacterized membrane protein
MDSGPENTYGRRRRIRPLAKVLIIIAVVIVGNGSFLLLAWLLGLLMIIKDGNPGFVYQLRALFFGALWVAYICGLAKVLMWILDYLRYTWD